MWWKDTNAITVVKYFLMKEIESDIKITSVRISKKQLFAQCQKKKQKRCDGAESRSGGSANSKLRKISDQFILSTDQSLAKHLNNNTNFYSRMILAMSLKVSVNGFWPRAFVNKNSTLYTKLSPYCAIMEMKCWIVLSRIHLNQTIMENS